MTVSHLHVKPVSFLLSYIDFTLPCLRLFISFIMFCLSLLLMLMGILSIPPKNARLFNKTKYVRQFLFESSSIIAAQKWLDDSTNLGFFNLLYITLSFLLTSSTLYLLLDEWFTFKFLFFWLSSLFSSLFTTCFCLSWLHTSSWVYAFAC